MRAGWAGVALVAAGVAAGVSVGLPSAQAQPPGGNAPAAPAKAPLPIANQGDQVLVKREATRLIDPEKYRVNLHLEPHAQVILSAPYDGVIRQVVEKVNSQVKPQSEIVRLDNTVQRLHHQRAQAHYRIATLEQKAAKDEDQKALATARLDAAKAELDLAQFQLDQTTLRSPIAGEVRRVHVVEGEYKRAGDPVAQIGDSSKLKVEIPIERDAVKVGDKLPVKIETNDLEGTVESLSPLRAEFDPLRDLFESIASAVVVFENPDGKLFAGQTVYVPLVPRNPIAEVPTGAVVNNTDGTRRVQVLRQSVVRDLPVTLMGPIGVDRLYVSGPFTANDEVIYETSHQLPDGFQLQPLAQTPATQPPATAPAAGGNRPRPAGF